MKNTLVAVKCNNNSKSDSDNNWLYLKIQDELKGQYSWQICIPECTEFPHALFANFEF
jgi:hypothetical protein